MSKFQTALDVQAVSQLEEYGDQLGEQLLEAMALIKRPLPDYLAAASQMTDPDDIAARDARVAQKMGPVVDELNGWPDDQRAFVKAQLAALAAFIND